MNWSGDLRLSDLELANSLRRQIAHQSLSADDSDTKVLVQKLRAAMQAMTRKSHAFALNDPIAFPYIKVYFLHFPFFGLTTRVLYFFVNS